MSQQKTRGQAFALSANAFNHLLQHVRLEEDCQTLNDSADYTSIATSAERKLSRIQLASHLIAAHLLSSHLSSHLISLHPMAPHRISSPLMSSHFVTSHLIASHLLIPSHLKLACLFPHRFAKRVRIKPLSFADHSPSGSASVFASGP